MEGITRSPNSYKYFNEIEVFLANLWKTFPSLFGNKNVGEGIKKILTEPILQNSIEYCKLKDNGTIFVKSFANGSFGAVGDIFINDDVPGQKLYAISTSVHEGFQPFYMNVIAKVAHEKSDFRWKVLKLSDVYLMLAKKKIDVEKNIYSSFYYGLVGEKRKALLHIQKGLMRSFATQAQKDELRAYKKLLDENSLKDIKIFLVADPLSEAVFGSVYSHLYDMGLCPFYSKYFGIFSCKGTVSMITEKCSFPFRNLLEKRREINYVKEINPWFIAVKDDPKLITNLIFQFIYAIYIGKFYAGITHFDTHYLNIMITYISRSFVNDKHLHTMDYVYKNQNLSTKKYIVMDMQHKVDGKQAFLIIKNRGLLLKMIDYGSCSMYLNKSKSEKYKKDLIISTIDEDLDKISRHGGLYLIQEHTKNDSKRNTVDILYFLNNIYEYMRKNIEDILQDRYHRKINTEKSFKARYAEGEMHYKKVLEELDNFSEKFFGKKLGDMLGKKASAQIKFNRGVHDYFSRDHDAGIPEGFEDPVELLKGMCRYCSSYEKNGQLYYFLENEIVVDKDANPENSLYLSVDDFDKKWNILDKFIKKTNKAEACFNKKGLDGCADLFSEVKKWDPSALLKRKLYAPIRKNSKIFSKNEIKDHDILQDSEYLIESDITDSFHIFSFQINPKALNMSYKTNGSSLFYSKYQNGLDYQEIADYISGNPIEIVNLHCLVVRPKTIFDINIYNTGSLWDVSKMFEKNTSGFAINGGYFTTPQNFNDLTKGYPEDGIPPNIVERNIVQKTPIGFFYNSNLSNNSNGTYLPVPRGYRSMFAVIYCRKKDSRIYIERYEEFMSKHETIQETVIYKMDSDKMKYYATSVPVIKMDTGKKQGNIPVLKDGTDIPYRWAFCTGPILVYDSKVVFDKKIMLEKEFYITEDDRPVLDIQEKPPNGEKYKVLPMAKNNKKFMVESNDKAGAYGSRHSNRLAIHNVMAIDKRGNLMFFFVEGRGFNAPGLDRVQVAYLISKFELLRAVSLDGGFSANALYKTSTSADKKYILNDPEKRKIGISMIFRFNA